MNPYWGVSFFEFFRVFFLRLIQGFPSPIAPDEIQLLVLSAVALSCGIIGPFLILKRAALFANSLSHTILLGIVGAYWLMSFLFQQTFFDWSTLLIGAFFAAFLTALFTEGLIRLCRLQEDASIGLVFTFLFALGITIVTLYFRNTHIGIESVMGNADVLQLKDAILPSVCSLTNLLFAVVFFRHLQMVIFDTTFASLCGVRAGILTICLLMGTAFTCVGAFRAVGVLLVLAFLVGPYLIVRDFSQKLSKLVFLSPLCGVVCTWIGVALSRHLLSVKGLPLSTGGLIVSLIGCCYGIKYLGLRMIGGLWRKNVLPS